MQSHGVGRSPRHFRVVLAVKRVLCVRTRRLLPSFSCENATSLPEGGLSVTNVLLFNLDVVFILIQ